MYSRLFSLSTALPVSVPTVRIRVWLIYIPMPTYLLRLSSSLLFCLSSFAGTGRRPAPAGAVKSLVKLFGIPGFELGNAGFADNDFVGHRYSEVFTDSLLPNQMEISLMFLCEIMYCRFARKNSEGSSCANMSSSELSM